MLWCSLLAAAAAALSLRNPPIRRLRVALPAAPPGSGTQAPDRRSEVWTSPWFAAALGAFAVTRFVPGWQGLALGLVVALGVRHWIQGLECAADKRRRVLMARDLPFSVDLVVAALEAGRPPGLVLGLVGEAVGGPLGEELAAARARLDLGVDPATLWHDMAQHAVLAPLGRSFARATQTGAPMTVVLSRCVEDLRRARRAEAQRVARSVGVQSAAPLGACFLPAFILVGIVPTTVGAFRSFVL
ncbi:MAG: type II secretion system F family protein [Nocardioidaceae bacterium]|nr:type II secretion system F family protein [Nocardioidaceae bacterium]